MGTRNKQISASPVVTRHTRPNPRAFADTDERPADAEVEERIRQSLGNANAAARKTVAVRVTEGRATTAGLVHSRDELAELENIVRRTPGVVGFCNLAVIDGRRADSASGVADALAETIGFECRESEVHVSVFGDTAVVSGHVNSPDDRLNVEILAQSHRGVREVVNRTTVVAASHGQ